MSGDVSQRNNSNQKQTTQLANRVVQIKINKTVSTTNIHN